MTIVLEIPAAQIERAEAYADERAKAIGGNLAEVNVGDQVLALVLGAARDAKKKRRKA